MSPVSQARRGVFYVMLAVMMLLTIANITIGAIVWDTRDTAVDTRGRLAIGCDRANRTREALHWLAATRDDVPGWIVAGLNMTAREFPQGSKPWLVDCDAAYP